MRLRKRFSNGVIIGIRRGEWWIGARYDLARDWFELNALGLTLFLPIETATDHFVRLVSFSRDLPARIAAGAKNLWNRHRAPAQPPPPSTS